MSKAANEELVALFDGFGITVDGGEKVTIPARFQKYDDPERQSPDQYITYEPERVTGALRADDGIYLYSEAYDITIASKIGAAISIFDIISAVEELMINAGWDYTIEDSSGIQRDDASGYRTVTLNFRKERSL